MNGILTAETEEVEWIANTEPKFLKKRMADAITTTYDSKTKKYIYNNTSTMPPSKPIRLELSQAFLHFSYHPERKEDIKIDPPAQQEAGTRYVVTVSDCH